VATTIIVKNGTSTPDSSAGLEGELLYNKTADKLFISTSDGADPTEVGNTTYQRLGTPPADFNTVESHNYYTTGSSGYYIPFGGSSTESSSTSYSLTDDTVFIAPYDGKLVKLYLYNDYSTDKDPLFTNCYLRVNGTLGAVLNGIGAANWSWQTSLQYTCDQNNTFDRGDILRVMVDPQKAPYYVALTSVWEWNM